MRACSGVLQHVFLFLAIFSSIMKTFGILLLLLLLLSKLLSATEENCFTVVIQTTTENASLQWRTTRLPEQNGCTTRSHNMIKVND